MRHETFSSVWLKKQLLKKYELETMLMGDDTDMEKETVYLGRTLEWGENGLGVRRDRRHVRSLLREFGELSKYFNATLRHREGNRRSSPEVSAEPATKHRVAVARVVYLVQDRLDLGVAKVELAKTMAIPREGDDERLKRVARYLHGHPDYMQWCPVQEDTKTVVSTGGTLQLGTHLIAAWSRVQPRIALSSGKAELYAGMRGISEVQDKSLGSDCSSCGCQCMSCHHVETWVWWSKTHHRQILVGPWSIEIERLSRDEMLTSLLLHPMRKS